MKVNEPYFEKERSIFSVTNKTEDVLRIVTNRYMADLPDKPFVARAFPKDNFLNEFSGRYLFNFDERFPDAELGDYAYAFAYSFSDEEWDWLLSFRAKASAWVYMNGELLYQTEYPDEIQFAEKVTCIKVKPGVNTFVVKCRKGVLDFGCEFGNTALTNGTIIFLNPKEGLKGKRGWAYTAPTKENIDIAQEDFWELVNKFNDKSLPVLSTKSLSIDEVLGKGEGYAYAMTELVNDGLAKPFTFKGESSGECEVFVDGENAFSGKGKIEFSVPLSWGNHSVCVQIKSDNNGKCGFSLETDALLTAEGLVRESGAKWLFLGKLSAPEKDILTNVDMLKVYGDDDNKCYWQTDLGDDVRLSMESFYYGRWLYTSGVCLYGLHDFAQELDVKLVDDYAKKHMNLCVGAYEYALWDTNKYGRAMLNYQLMTMNCLDYCGSCGNAMLRLFDYNEPAVKNLADVIADYMQNKQERLSNGMFYRGANGSWQEGSVWADDLYMSVPFLCQYYKATGKKEFLDDAVNQFKCYYDYLYMPEQKIMSHVYSEKYKRKNKIPWGRGNGWVLFTLTELLAVLPKEHSGYDFIVEFFQELCEGIISYQDENGMWHQVIDEPSTFVESSCTAMFVTSFCRGIINGWISDEKFAKAAFAGWKALCTYCVDYKGNFYGVCIGSGLSFRREYYVNELEWLFNDTHGTGMVLLAGVSILHMQNDNIKL